MLNIDKLKEKLDIYTDIVLVSDNPIPDSSYATIPMFYTKFSSYCNIVFFTIRDYINYREYFSSDQIILALSKEEALSSELDCSRFKINRIIEL